MSSLSGIQEETKGMSSTDVVRRLKETDVIRQRTQCEEGRSKGQEWAKHRADRQHLRNLEARLHNWLELPHTPEDHCWATEACHDAQASDLPPLLDYKTLFGEWMPTKVTCNWYFVSGFVKGAVEVFSEAESAIDDSSDPAGM